MRPNRREDGKRIRNKPKPCVTQRKNIWEHSSEIIKHSLAARVSYISLVFSNFLRVLSQCNTRLRFLTNSGSNKVFNDVYNKLFSCKACLVVGDACFPRVYGPDKNLNHEKRIPLSHF